MKDGERCNATRRSRSKLQTTNINKGDWMSVANSRTNNLNEGCRYLGDLFPTLSIVVVSRVYPIFVQRVRAVVSEKGGGYLDMSGHSSRKP